MNQDLRGILFMVAQSRGGNALREQTILNLFEVIVKTNPDQAHRIIDDLREMVTCPWCDGEPGPPCERSDDDGNQMLTWHCFDCGGQEVFIRMPGEKKDDEL